MSEFLDDPRFNKHHDEITSREGHDWEIQEGVLQPWSSRTIEYMWNVLKQYGVLKFSESEAGMKAAKEWRDIIMNLIDNNYRVSIASFGSFRPLIEKYLTDIVMLPPEYMKKITVHSWMPVNPDSQDTNKNAHLDRIMRSIPPTEEINLTTQVLSDEQRRLFYRRLILIDDSGKNTAAVNSLLGDENHSIKVNSDDPGYKNPEIVRNKLTTILGISFNPRPGEERLAAPEVNADNRHRP